MAYAATFDIQPPERFQKPHVAIRVLVVIILWLLGGAIGWVLGAVYLILPVLAAIMISQKGAEQYLAESPGSVTRWLRYLVAAYAYMGFLTDRLPNEDPEQTLRLEVRPTGTPTVGSALLRIILGIPSALVLAIIGIAFIVVVPVAAISILINETVPDWAYNFTRGFLRWQTRLYAYMASLVDEYPPFSFSDGEGAPAQASTPPPAVEAPPAQEPTGEAGDRPSQGGEAPGGEQQRN